MKFNVIVRQFTLLAMVFIPSVSTAATMLVIESNTASYRTKQIINSVSTLSLEAGEKITLLAESGEIYELTGPHRGAPSKTSGRPAKRADIPASLWLLIKPEITRSKSFKPLRGYNPEAYNIDRPDDPAAFWWVDIEMQEAQCVLSNQPTKLWRKYANMDVQMTLTRESNSQSVDLFWAAGTHVMDWPTTLEFVTGETYTVEREGFPHKLTIQEVPAAVAGQALGSLWLEARECLTQAQAFDLRHQNTDE